MKIYDYNTTESIHDKLKVFVDYEKGGYNYFSGKITKRGYYLYIKPFTKDNGTEVVTLLGSRVNAGGKILLKEARRFNKNTLEKIRKSVEPYTDKVTEEFIKNKGYVNSGIINEIKEEL